ncbi:MAG: alpha/beta hydrolase [Nostoc sp. ChiSLP02]|nr:alpha/beta hydrolase [Nostoc sp. DedSLP05]MDZ8102920.1 alpha/beta hydrolase [Nostoc sp. DedSLP01]MDZ8183526.1 alpha/beta hydrolase [Nostoc sp. ChiSLP02]
MTSINNLVKPPERQTKMRLRDGRMLAWSEWGPIDGLPVLFCTGAGMSGRLGFGIDELPDLGLKLIAIDRPGVGLSDPHPNKTLFSWVDDTQEFIQANHLNNVLCVGFSQGAPFALALAGRNLVKAIAIVSGQDELTYERLKPLLHPDVERMICAVQQDPIKFEQHFAQMATPEGMWQLIIGMSSECDRILYEDDKFRAAYQQALTEGFSQGAHSYARDLVNALSSWSIKLEEITVPVDLWYGALDTSTVHSPDFGATLALRLPNATHTIDTTQGGSILWIRARDILAKLKSHVSTT